VENKSKYWVVMISLFVIVIVIAILMNDVRIITAASATFFAVSMLLLTNDQMNDAEKNRPSAMLRSYVPGLAHIYLGMYRRAMAFSFGYLAIALCLLGAFMTAPNGLPSVLAMFGVIFGIVFFSMIDAEAMCNKLRLPYISFPQELRIKNYNLAFFVTLLIVYVFCIADAASELLKGNNIDQGVNTAILAAGTVALVLGFVVFIILKRIPNNDMGRPPSPFASLRRSGK